MKLNQWKMMEAKLDFIYSSEDLTSKEQANLVLWQIALMLAKIADILEGRNVELKDGKTAQNTMQDHIQ